MSCMPKVQLIRAAGCLLWRRSGSSPAGVELALVHRPRRADWSLAKGKLESDEAWPAAAVREVYEETGWSVALGPPLPTQRYEVDGVPKEVRYWAAEVTDTDAAAQPFQANDEVDAAMWLDPVTAREQLSYAHDAEVVDGMVALLEPPDHEPIDVLIVLRHARAMKRAVWRGKDDKRPLDDRGFADAEALTAILSAYAPTQVHSSNTARCLDTVDPYVAAHQLDVVLEPQLSERGHRHKPSAAAKRTEALLALGGRAVLCSHRPVIPAILAAAVGDDASTALIGDGLPPGAMIVIHHRKGAVVAAERHDP